ncbi:MAG: hypothetical protein K2K48_00095 [Anaeroplasmataceae bacterium]|nr:hypothetical protein [Anaeroplasmataceae bacterium]MDE6413797.1 hypothetical protein [Anaeroplasmataceae bacterium]
MNNVVFTPKEEELTEELPPEPEKTEPEKIETIIRIQTEPKPKRKAYQKPTLVAQEPVHKKEIDFYDEEEEEYDDNDEYNSYNFEPEEDEVEETIEESKETQPLEEPTPEPIVEETFVVESFDQNTNTCLFDETEVVLPVLDMDAKEETVIEEQPEKEPLENLENESYAEEFEPKDSEDIEEILEPSSNEEEIIEEPDYADASLEQMMETIVQLETNNQMPPEYMTSDYTYPTAMLPQPSSDPAAFMPPVPAGPLMDVPYESPKDIPALENNPYFRSRKMNFHLKPIILSLVSVIIFIGVFISIFAILHAFK